MWESKCGMVIVRNLVALGRTPHFRLILPSLTDTVPHFKPISPLKVNAIPHFVSISEQSRGGIGLFTNLSIYAIVMIVPSGEHRWALTVCVSFGKTFGNRQRCLSRLGPLT